MTVLFSRRSVTRTRRLLIPEMVLQRLTDLERRSLAGAVTPLHPTWLKDLQPMLDANQVATLSWVPLTEISNAESPLQALLDPQASMPAPASLTGTVALYNFATSNPGYTSFDTYGTFNPPGEVINHVPFQEAATMGYVQMALTDQSGNLIQTGSAEDMFTQEDANLAGTPTNTIILGDLQELTLARNYCCGAKTLAIEEDLIGGPRGGNPPYPVHQNYDLYTVGTDGKLHQFAGGNVNYSGQFYLQYTPPVPHAGGTGGATLYFNADGVTVSLNVGSPGLYVTYSTLSGPASYNDPGFVFGGSVDITFGAQNVPEPPNATNHVSFYTTNNIFQMGPSPGYQNRDGITWKYNIDY